MTVAEVYAYDSGYVAGRRDGMAEVRRAVLRALVVERDPEVSSPERRFAGVLPTGYMTYGPTREMVEAAVWDSLVLAWAEGGR